MKKKQNPYARDASYDDKAALKSLQREFSNLTTPRGENVKAALKSLTDPADKKDMGNPGEG